MACSDVKLACCRLCGQKIASNLGECIHCGVCKPIKEEKCGWLHKILFIILIVGTILVTIRYEGGRRFAPDCPLDDVGYSGRC